MSALNWLFERFDRDRDKTFIVWHERDYKYAFLLEEIRRWQKVFDEAHLKQGQVVSLEADYSPSSVAALLALVERGTIVVPLADEVAEQKEELRTIANVQVSIVLKPDGSHSTERYDRQPDNSLQQELIRSERPGLVVFSSGSTGKSKAALHDFIPLLEKFKQPRHCFVTLTFLLLDHLGGINTLFYTLANTGTIVTVDERSPGKVLQAAAKHRVELLPTSPTFLNLVLISEVYKDLDLSSLKRITYGAEVMPARTLERLCEIFPEVEFQQTYGLSELGVLRTKSRARNSLWMKIGGKGFETRVVDGLLHIRAQSLMLGYLNAPSPVDAEGWFNTADAVEMDGEWLRILGRKSDMINVGGLKVFPAEVESVLLTMPNVNEVVVRAESHPITGQVVVAHLSLLEHEEPAELRRRLQAFCKDKLSSYKIPVKAYVVEHEQFNQRYKKIRRQAAGSAGRS